MTTIKVPALANGTAIDADEVQAFMDACEAILNGNVTAENLKARYQIVPYVLNWSIDDDDVAAGSLLATGGTATVFKLPSLTVTTVITIKDILLYATHEGPGANGTLKAVIRSDSTPAVGGNIISTMVIPDPGAAGAGEVSIEDPMSHRLVIADRYMSIVPTPEFISYWKNVTVSFNLVYEIQE